MEPTPDTRTDDGLAAPRNAADGNDAAGAVGRGHRADTEAPAPASSAEDAALDALGALADPVRRALYRYVAAASEPIGRAEAAEAVGVGRTLAAHHLDRLVDAGFLDTEFARPAGRGGPGAGRPAKVYRRAAGETAVAVPPRAYDTAGTVLAAALERLRADATVAAVARDEGRAVGQAFRGAADDPRGRLLAALTAQGYEPYADPAAGLDALRLRNCPFHRLADEFPPLVCGMNLALLDGLADGADATAWHARMDAAPGRCCVTLARTEPPAADDDADGTDGTRSVDGAADAADSGI
ncbi:helix-turn-helix transcriptional regulator [Uniformispora flossi]|uniref:helix-turn-helix transcriptional regulator n=1 Tax=Uniformispora flossi TaxID=3390723 RepID=UPI003C2EBCCF